MGSERSAVSCLLSADRRPPTAANPPSCRSAAKKAGPPSALLVAEGRFQPTASPSLAAGNAYSSRPKVRSFQLYRRMFLLPYFFSGVWTRVWTASAGRPFLEHAGLTEHGTAGKKRDNVSSGGAAAHIIYLFLAGQGPVRPTRNAGVLSWQASPPYCPNFRLNPSFSEVRIKRRRPALGFL